MGLYISHLDTVSIKAERSLYIYLLDYGWPDGQWETLFKKHFMKMADLAAENGAVVVGSPNGIHFGNEVLSWHKVGGLNAEEVLPGLLLTKTHPDYFAEGTSSVPTPDEDLEQLLVVPLKPFCTDEDGFVRTIERIFADLKSGLELKDFAVAQHDVRIPKAEKLGRRIADAIEIKPGAFGCSIDLKALLS